MNNTEIQFLEQEDNDFESLLTLNDNREYEAQALRILNIIGDVDGMDHDLWVNNNSSYEGLSINDSMTRDTLESFDIRGGMDDIPNMAMQSSFTCSGGASLVYFNGRGYKIADVEYRKKAKLFLTNSGLRLPPGLSRESWLRKQQSERDLSEKEYTYRDLEISAHAADRMMQSGITYKGKTTRLATVKGRVMRNHIMDDFRYGSIVRDGVAVSLKDKFKVYHGVNFTGDLVSDGVECEYIGGIIQEAVGENPVTFREVEGSRKVITLFRKGKVRNNTTSMIAAYEAVGSGCSDIPIVQNSCSGLETRTFIDIDSDGNRSILLPDNGNMCFLLSGMIESVVRDLWGDSRFMRTSARVLMRWISQCGRVSAVVFISHILSQLKIMPFSQHWGAPVSSDPACDIPILQHLVKMVMPSLFQVRSNIRLRRDVTFTYAHSHAFQHVIVGEIRHLFLEDGMYFMPTPLLLRQLKALFSIAPEVKKLVPSGDNIEDYASLVPTYARQYNDSHSAIVAFNNAYSNGMLSSIVGSAQFAVSSVYGNRSDIAVPIILSIGDDLVIFFRGNGIIFQFSCIYTGSTSSNSNSNHNNATFYNLVAGAAKSYGGA